MSISQRFNATPPKLKRFMAHLGLYLMVFSAIAQASAEPETKVTRTFKVTCLGNWTGGDLFVDSSQEKLDSKEMAQVQVFDMSYSPAMPYKSGQPIRFFKKTASEETPYELALTVAIPKTIKSPLILLISREKKISFRVFDIDPKTFPFGSWRMVNLSKKMLLASIDKEVKPLPPGKEVDFITSGKKFVRSWVRIGSKDSKKIVFSTMIIRRSHKRMIVFLGGGHDIHGQETLNSRMLVDFESSQEKEE